MLNLLIAEKDPKIRLTYKNLFFNIFNMFEADNGIEAIEISERENIALYLINCDVPFITERGFLGRFENMPIQPLLIYGVTAECSLPKEFPYIHFFEQNDDVVAMRRAVDLMRFHHYGSSDDPRFFIYSGLEIDYFLRKLKVDGKEARLTPKEFDLLVFLLSHSGEQFSREELLETVWGYEFLGDSRTIDTHVKSLRNKLGPYRALVVTIWGKGYKVELPETWAEN